MPSPPSWRANSPRICRSTHLQNGYTALRRNRALEGPCVYRSPSHFACLVWGSARRMPPRRPSPAHLQGKPPCLVQGFGAGCGKGAAMAYRGSRLGDATGTIMPISGGRRRPDDRQQSDLATSVRRRLQIRSECPGRASAADSERADIGDLSAARGGRDHLGTARPWSTYPRSCRSVRSWLAGWPPRSTALTCSAPSQVPSPPPYSAPCPPIVDRRPSARAPSRAPSPASRRPAVDWLPSAPTVARPASARRSQPLMQDHPLVTGEAGADFVPHRPPRPEKSEGGVALDHPVGARRQRAISRRPSPSWSPRRTRMSATRCCSASPARARPSPWPR